MPSNSNDKLNNLVSTHNLCLIPSNNCSHATSAIIDTGATAHYVMSTAPTQNTTSTNAATTVHLPNGDTLSSHLQGILQYPNLSPEATTAHILPNLQHNLLSVGQLCDAGLTALFSKNKVVIQRDNQTIIEGQRNHQNGLWMTELPSQQCHMTYMSKNTKNLIKFMYAALCSPSLSTLTKAINNKLLQSWP